jgi:transposase
VRLDARIGELDEELKTIVRETPAAQQLLVLRGVGPTIATALVAALGTGESFARGREFAVAMGLKLARRFAPRKAKPIH